MWSLWVHPLCRSSNYDTWYRWFHVNSTPELLAPPLGHFLCGKDSITFEDLFLIFYFNLSPYKSSNHLHRLIIVHPYPYPNLFWWLITNFYRIKPSISKIIRSSNKILTTDRIQNPDNILDYCNFTERYWHSRALLAFLSIRLTEYYSST